MSEEMENTVPELSLDNDELSPEEAASPVARAVHAETSGVRRRTYLAAAAIGSAAAQLVGFGGVGLRLGTRSAFADDLSSLNCTANDVRVVGPGIILNEDCTCSGTFTAQVRFRIVNNTGTSRYCVTAHLCAGKNAAGQVVVPAQDIVFGDIPANFDGFKTISLPNYPCGAGLVCFGGGGSGEDGAFLKGESCPQGECCATITWNVKASDPCPDTTRQISSKCRHQSICIQGRANPTLDCNISQPGVQTNCPVQCGQTATLRLSAPAGATGPYLYTLDGQNFGPTNDTFHDFTVGPLTQPSTNFSGSVTTEAGTANACLRNSNSVTLTTTVLTAPTLAAPQIAQCTGVVTLDVTPCPPQAGVTYTLEQVACSAGATLVTPSSGPTYNAANCRFTLTLPLGTTSCWRVRASNGSSDCDVFSNTQTVTVNSAVQATLAMSGTPGCNGVVTLLATASGGSGTGYGFSFVGATGEVGTVAGNPNARTLTVQPLLDGSCRSVTVNITDSNGCGATSTAVSFSQCATTTQNC